MTNVWVVIVGYRNAEDIETCLGAVSQQSYSDWGVVICENGGSAAFSRLVEMFCPAASSSLSQARCTTNISEKCSSSFHGAHPIHLLKASKNLGYAGAINAAILQIEQTHEWSFIWILNPDAEPHQDALARLIDKASDPAYGIIGSRLIYKETNLVQAYGGIWQTLRSRGVSIGRNNEVDNNVREEDVEIQMDYVLGACMLVTRSYVRHVGLMRDDYFLYCEEVDWCLRRKDFKLGYAHQSLVYHVQGTTIGSKGGANSRSRLAAYLDERNRLLIARRFFRSRLPIIALVTIARLSRYPKNAAWQNFFVALQGWWDGLCNRSGVPGPIGDHRTAAYEESNH